jgi:zinc and cadmium transporter
MNNAFFYALISVLIVSAVSLIGVVTLALKQNLLKKLLLFFVSFSAGALFGDAFIHLIPEALETLMSEVIVSLFVIAGLMIFFVLEKFIHWRHCHVPTCKEHPHPIATMNLLGDALHNLIDGMIIGASYLASIPLGITTTLAVVLHEIPQEISDFGVLIYGGFTKRKALMMNFFSALTSVIGAIITFLVGSRIESFSALLVPITAGGFIYIAGSDLIPELHKEVNVSKSVIQFLSILFGVGVMLALLLLE